MIFILNLLMITVNGGIIRRLVTCRIGIILLRELCNYMGCGYEIGIGLQSIIVSVLCISF